MLTNELNVAGALAALALGLISGCSPEAGGQAAGASDAVVAVPASEAAPATNAPPAASNEIAAAFHGEWNNDREACGKGLNDSRLTLGARQVDYHESGGPVISAVSRTPQDLALTVELSGEGETNVAVYRYELSQDGQTLTDVTNPAEPFVRHRCP